MQAVPVAHPNWQTKRCTGPQERLACMSEFLTGVLEALILAAFVAERNAVDVELAHISRGASYVTTGKIGMRIIARLL